MDFEAYSPKTEATDLEALVAKAEEAIELAEIIEAHEEELSQLKARLRQMTDHDLPSMLSELGMNDFSLSDGTKLKIKDFVAGSLNKSTDKQAALDWIVEHDGRHLIKTDVKVQFDKSEHNMALSFAAELQEKGLEYNLEEGIHPQTLASYARELWADYKDALSKGEKGIEPPFELLGLYQGRKVEIKKGEK